MCAELDSQTLQDRLRRRWGRLTPQDLDRIGADRQTLIEVLADRYGRAREVIEREVTEFYSSVVDKAEEEDEEV